MDTCDVQISNPLSYTVEKFKLINCVSLSIVTSSLPSLLVNDDSLLRTKYPCPLNNGGPVGSSEKESQRILSLLHTY